MYFFTHLRTVPPRRALLLALALLGAGNSFAPAARAQSIYLGDGQVVQRHDLRRDGVTVLARLGAANPALLRTVKIEPAAATERRGEHQAALAPPVNHQSAPPDEQAEDLLAVGSAETSSSVDFVDEQVITISDAGEVALNDEPFDDPKSESLPQLTATLQRLKQASDAAKTQLAITIASESKAEYGRGIDVLNALAAAHIDNVTFTVDDEE